MKLALQPSEGQKQRLAELLKLHGLIIAETETRELSTPVEPRPLGLLPVTLLTTLERSRRL